ncbi:serpin-like protein [Lasius niger]|uniref:Serpin-like protein n=1 Tax=Lasius niger TaxID=67767 RepID=A0A0J7K4B1_LASNI|nr:serpin-like protein [Lasius niger]
MFLTELPYMHKNQSLYLLFPAAKSIETCAWEVDENISGLVERLTTNAGIDKLRKVLESQVSLPECAIYPEFLEMEHELEHELPIDELLEDLGIRELLEPDKAILSNFTHENLHLGGAMHRAYIKMTPEKVISGAVNMFFTKNEATFKSFEKTNNSQYEYSFVLLIYDRDRRDILFTGIINKNHQLPDCKCS